MLFTYEINSSEGVSESRFSSEYRERSNENAQHFANI